MLALTVVSGVAWLLLLLAARHRLESGKPPSHPDSRESRGWVRASQAVGGLFGAFLGAEFGGFFEVIAAGVAMAILSGGIFPHQKRLRSGASPDRRINAADDETEPAWDAEDRRAP